MSKRKRPAKRKTAAFKRRSEASKRGWVTRRAKAAYAKVTTPGAPRARPTAAPAPKVTRPWPVYDWRHVRRGAELGHARSVVDASDVAEDAAPDFEELDFVEPGYGPRGARAWLAHFKPTQEEGEEEPQDEADEWEIGFEYRGADRGSHVDINIRIAREDGGAFGPKEAARVLSQFRQNLGNESRDPIPTGYTMAFIDWRRPRWGTEWQGGGGDEGHLQSFHAPMYVESGDDSAWSILPAGDVRLGSIK